MSPPPPSIPLPHELALNESTSWSKSPFPKLPNRGQVMRVLTLTQNTSAMVFSIFLIPHLASPLVASAAGLEGADKTMMIARDLYLPLEPYLIYLPLTLHLSSSILRRLLILTSTNSNSNSNSLWRSLKSRLPRQLHQIVGYPLTILLISHFLTHRWIPSSSSSPISELSPSELSYEFVGYNLRDPVSWLSYLALVGLGGYHSLIGTFKIVGWVKRGRESKEDINYTTNKLNEIDCKDGGDGGDGKDEHVIIVNQSGDIPKRSIIPKKSIIGVRAFMVAFLGIITIGLWRIRKDTGLISPVMKVRYDAIYKAAPWTGLWR